MAAMTPPVQGQVQLSRPSLTEEEIRAAERVLRSGWLVMGPECRAFEEELAAACGRRYAAVVSSGTAALHLCLLALWQRDVAGWRAQGQREGDGAGAEGPALLVPALTFPATANVARFVEPALPVRLGDVDPQTFCLPEAAVAEHLRGGRGPVMVVHQFGYPSPVPAAQADLVISDAACAIGVPAAMGGRCACLSFHPRKVLTTCEGGAVLTDDEALIGEIRALRAHGLLARPGEEVMDAPYPGLNYRLTEVAAAIGRVQLRRLPRLIEAHAERAMRYRERLLGRLPMQADAPGRIWQTVAVVLPAGTDRPALRQELRRQGIETQIASYGLHRLASYRGGESGAALALALPGADLLHDRGLALPLHAELPLADVDRVCDALLQALERAHKQGQDSEA